MKMSLDQVRSSTVSPAASKEAASGTSHLFFPLLILVTSIALLARIDNLSYVTESLWAEDGYLFINQSHQLGVRSFWVPHAGQLFLYHRVVALLATPAPLVAIPYIFFLAWLMAFVLTVAFVKSRAKSVGLNELTIAFLVCAIALQPNHGEPFFNLNHAHYFLGIALAFHVCIPSQKPASVPTIVFLILASLSGPFSAFLIGILALQWLILRDFSSRKATYTIVPICGLIQSIFLFGSQRGGQIDLSVAHWTHAISSFLFFGESNRLGTTAALIFWVTTLVFFFKWLAQMRHSPDRTLWLSPLFSIVTAFLLFFTGALGAGDWLANLSPLDMCSRFFLIPYSLVFFTALACTQNYRAVQTVVISLISIICASGFLTVDRVDRASSTGLLSHENLQWTAFVKFREMKTDVAIPVNPAWPYYPPISVAFEKVGTADGLVTEILKPILLIPQQSTSLQRAVSLGKTLGDLKTETGQTLYFDIKDYCSTSSYLGLEIDIWRSRMGWAKLYWGKSGGFDSERSLRRFYPAGAAVMQFAWRRDTSDYLIKLDPAEGVSDSAVVRFFLDMDREKRLSRAGIVVAEPTRPGGEIRIKEVRLFCLK